MQKCEQKGIVLKRKKYKELGCGFEKPVFVVWSNVTDIWQNQGSTSAGNQAGRVNPVWNNGGLDVILAQIDHGICRNVIRMDKGRE